MTVKIRRPKRYRISSVTRRAPVMPKRELSYAGRLFLILSAVCAAGVFIGAYSFNRETSALTELISCHGEKTFTAVFADDMMILGVYILICFFGGFSALGRPAAYLLVLFKGMGAGRLAACVIPDMAGNLSSAAVILPFEILGTAAVIFAARESIRLSALISQRTFGSGGEEVPADIGLYPAKFGVITAAAAAASVVDGLLSISP
ncbi:MAG: stage II sporulation protein M [Huintestinicola sp.]